MNTHTRHFNSMYRTMWPLCLDRA